MKCGDCGLETEDRLEFKAHSLSSDHCVAKLRAEVDRLKVETTETLRSQLEFHKSLHQERDSLKLQVDAYRKLIDGFCTGPCMCSVGANQEGRRVLELIKCCFVCQARAGRDEIQNTNQGGQS